MKDFSNPSGDAECQLDHSPVFEDTARPSDRDVMPGARQNATLPRLVDIQSVAGSLGVSVRQVRRWVAEGQIPFVRVGHLIRFDPDDLNEWINARRVRSVKST
jgi:excisionase family DNA binding protein